MTEANFVGQVVTYLRGHGVKVFKHNDGFTVGIPDLSVTWAGRTSWLEVKVTRDDPIARLYKNPKDHVQLKTMRDLGRLGRAFYVFWDRGKLAFWPPEFLAREVILVKNPRSWAITDYDQGPDWVLDDEDNPSQVLIHAFAHKIWKYPIAFEFNLEHVKTLVEV